MTDTPTPPDDDAHEGNGPASTTFLAWELYSSIARGIALKAESNLLISLLPRFCGLSFAWKEAQRHAMAQSKPPGPKALVVDFKFTKDGTASAKLGLSCRCGGKSFREVHRISQPKGGTSIMYECAACGEYSL